MSYETAISRGRKTGFINGYCTATVSHGKTLSWSVPADVVTTATVQGALSTTTNSNWLGHYVKHTRDRAWSNIAGVAYDPDGHFKPRSNVLIIDSGYVPEIWVDTLPGDASMQPLAVAPYLALGPTNYGTYGPSQGLEYFHDEGFLHPFIRGAVFDPVRDSVDVQVIAYGDQAYGQTGTVEAFLRGGWG